MKITYFYQTNTDLFLEGHIAHSYYMLLMIAWTLSLDEHLSTDVVYFDFSKAPHQTFVKA